MNLTRRRSRPLLGGVITAAAACLLVTGWGCASGDSPEASPSSDATVPSGERSSQPSSGDSPASEDEQPAIDMASRSGCATDFDCDSGLVCFGGRCLFECERDEQCAEGETCSERGRCVRSNGRPAAHPTGNQASLDVETDLSKVARVLPSDTSYDIIIDVLDAGPGGVPYWIERSDEGLQGGSIVPELGRLMTGRNVIQVPVGAASPNAENPQPVELRIHTGIGTLSGRMEPVVPAEGLYAAAVEFNQLEGAPLDLVFELVTEPVGASLALAENVWVRLFPDPDALLSFNGHAAVAPDGPQGVSPNHLRRLVLQDDGSWVATFVGSWAPGGQAVGLLDPSPVGGTYGRSLRVTIRQAFGGIVEGELQDRWVGIDGTDDESGFVGPILAERFGEVTLAPPGPTEVGANRSWTFGSEDGSAFPACTAEVLADPVFDPACADVAAGGLPTTAPDIRAAAECGRDAVIALRDEPSVVSCIDGFLGDGDGEACSVSNMQALAIECAASYTGRSRSDFAPPGFAVDESGPATLCAPARIARHACAAELIGGAAGAAVRRDLALAPADALAAWVDAVRESALPLELIAAERGAELRFRWFDLSPPGANRLGWGAFDSARNALLDEVDDLVDLRMSALRLSIGRHSVAVLSQLRDVLGDNESLVEAVRGMLGAWQLALDELQYAAQRQSLTLDSDSARAAALTDMRRHGMELYLAAHILRRAARTLPRSDADLIRAMVARGFGEFENAVSLLGLTVAELRNQRDGEVARFTGVDGEQMGVVAQRAQRAQQLVGRLDGMQARLQAERNNTLDDLQLQQRDAANVRNLREQLALMCGVDLARCNEGNEPVELRCEPLVGPERCGFPILDGELSTGVENVSEVARAMNAIVRAALGVELAIEEHRAFHAKVALEEERVRTFEQFTEDWLRMAEGNAEAWMDSIREEQALLAEAGQIRSQRGFWDRVQSFADTASSIIGGVQTGVGSLTKPESTARSILTSVTSERFADRLRGWADVDEADAGRSEAGEGDGNEFIAALPETTHLAWHEMSRLDHDQFDRLQTAAAQSGYMRLRPAIDVEHLAPGEQEKFLGKVTAGLQVVSTVAGIFGRRARAKREKRAAEKEAQAREVAMRRDYERMLRDAQLQNLQNEQQIADRQITLKQMLEDSASYLIRIQQAENEVDRLVDEVLAMQRRAELMAFNIDQLEADLRARDALRYAPYRYFDRIGLLYEAEELFEAARLAIFDYLVAVEYVSVRPFFTIRDRLIRARSWSELRQVMDELDDARQFCGGQTSTASDRLSLRRDVLRITSPVRDPLTGEAVGVAAQFRNALERAHFARDTVVDQDARFSRGIFQSLRDSQLMALRFELKLDEFSNLFTVCNARIESVSAQLIGDIGTGNPAVTLVYDGHGILESCHDEGIMSDWESTQFGPRTMIVSRPVNSTASVTVNEPPQPGFGNRSLNGLPVAGRYTLFIEQGRGGNREFDWSRIEDIVLHVNYTYQNFYPASDRCSN
ncbi:MAG: hypothetical protein EA398_12135 [Deltaproteobacteria bacterium]|nr:MAG: hypothetical protein EA398_12135 [Deltaproteobacteria bacterium]